VTDEPALGGAPLRGRSIGSPLLQRVIARLRRNAAKIGEFSDIQDGERIG
jgi:hypothetical protein